MQKDPSRRRFPLPDRVIEVVDDTLTGEVLLDEALKLMKTSEKMSVSSWIDLLSGELIFLQRHRDLSYVARGEDTDADLFLCRRDLESHEDWLST